jgi:hypothetical protein
MTAAECDESGVFAKDEDIFFKTSTLIWFFPCPQGIRGFLVNRLQPVFVAIGCPKGNKQAGFPARICL